MKIVRQEPQTNCAVYIARKLAWLAERSSRAVLIVGEPSNVLSKRTECKCDMVYAMFKTEINGKGNHEPVRRISTTSPLRPAEFGTRDKIYPPPGL